MVLTLTPNRDCTPVKNRRIPTIPAGFTDVGPANFSAVDTGPRRSESGVPAARPGASVIGPSPLSPDRRLRWSPVVMVGRRLRPEFARVGPGRPTERGSGSTGQGLCILHEGPTYLQYPQPSSSSTPPLVQCTQTTTAATTATGPAPSNRPKQQHSHLADAPKRRLEKSWHPKLSEVMRQHRGGASQERRARSRSSPTRATATAMVPAIPTACRFPRGAQA